MEGPEEGSGIRRPAGEARASRPAKESWEVEGHQVPVSNLDKVLWPEEGHTKDDLLRYYLDVAPLVVPFVEDRPLTLYRCPDGIRGECFYQKEAPDFMPRWVRTERLPTESEDGETNFVIGGGAATLVYLTNLGCVEHNPWSSRIAQVGRPDLLLLDLDPAEVDFSEVRGAAELVGEVLGELGLRPFVKTSGGKGIHVMAPLRPEKSFEEVRALAKRAAEQVRSRDPRLFTLSPRKSARKGKIFLDYLRNARGATMVSPYSVRPRPGAPVSTPLDWEELKRSFEPRDYHLGNIRRRLGQKEDPFARFWRA